MIAERSAAAGAGFRLVLQLAGLTSYTWFTEPLPRVYPTVVSSVFLCSCGAAQNVVGSQGDALMLQTVEISPIKISLVAPRVRTLVVDDSPSFRQLACTFLESEPGIEVVGQATSGAEALAAVFATAPDLVLMDVQMPKMSGLTAAMLIALCFPRTRVILMSSDDSPRLRANCDGAGVCAFIPKSMFISEFLLAVGPITREVST
jgi:CheY-like chemotaxis protein